MQPKRDIGFLREDGQNGAKSASNVQAGAFRELDSQSYGLP